MKVLIIGSGGREHAIVWKLSQSPLVTKLYTAPGNAGTSEVDENTDIDISDFTAIKSFVLEKSIDMVVVGPEVPLVEGIHDFFLADDELKNIPVIGPVAKAALLEASKDFAKKFMNKYRIATAGYQTFDKQNINKASDFLKTLNPPYVLKADGLAAGKGVLIIDSYDEAVSELNEMINEEKFGTASQKVVIEEFLTGVELSVFVLTDGESYKILPSAKDYKRIGEGDTGLNTGGMGSISPVPFADEEFMKKVETRIIKPTIDGLKSEGLVYKGFIFFGLISVNGNPFVIEYNIRMGDPEAESVIPRIKSDLMELFIGTANGDLQNRNITIDERYCTAIFLVSGGYPGSYPKNKLINGLDETNDSILFHAGTKIDPESGGVFTNGGRVIAISSFGQTMKEALDKSYQNANKITFEGKYYRKDLGRDIMNQ
ncbi:MAG: phosphoribosylamine--glycine ligase [Bacteroidales bacterium]|nr:phosphoribosylamine--glycine ligase [Bacteroidales bacterium]